MKKLLYLFEQNQADKNYFKNAPGSEKKQNGVIYRVEQCDDLQKIAIKFNCPPSVIVADNMLTDALCAGNLLFVKNGNKPLYRIRPQDDLSYLIRLSGLTLDDLLRINAVKFFYPWQLISLG